MRKTHFSSISVLVLFVAMGMILPSSPKSNSLGYIVQLKTSQEKAFKDSVTQRFNWLENQVNLTSIFKEKNIYSVELIQTSFPANQILNILKKLPQVEFVEEDQELSLRGRPNDIDYSEQWDMEIIQTPELWDFTPGGTSALNQEIVVAVIDDGYQFTHKDLEQNIWINDAEIPSNNIDDDGNGFTDDYFGPNIRTKNGDHPLKRHGTSVAGIIGAVGNNDIGVTGVNWNVKLMLLSNAALISDLIKAYEYILDQRTLYNTTNGARGAFVVTTNLSAGLPERFADEFPIWCSIYNSLGQQGVINVSATSNLDIYIDDVGDMPSLCSSDYLIVANNTTKDDTKATETGKSAIHVDLGAPGDDSYTLSLNNSYNSFSGTSAAAPHVAGAVALLYSVPCLPLAEMAVKNPASAALLIKNAILDGVDPLTDLQGITLSEGRLNVFNAALQLREICKGSSGILNIQKIYPSPATDIIHIQYETPDLEPYELYIFDMAGNKITHQVFSPPIFGEKELTLDITNLAKGLYTANIRNSNDQTSYKFMVY